MSLSEISSLAAGGSAGTSRLPEKLRYVAVVLLWILLSGYLIFNKPFAVLCYPPLYIGELVLAFCVYTALFRIEAVALPQFWNSWVFRFCAILWMYGIVRVAIDARVHGSLALRDSMTTGYAMVAFLAPLTWTSRLDSDAERADLPTTLLRVILPVSVLGAGWAAAIRYGYVSPPQDLKVDFLTMAAAVAFWVWSMSAVKAIPFNKSSHTPATARRMALLILSVFFSGLFFLIMLALPTRAVWLVMGPLGLVSALALSGGSRLWLAIIGGVVVVGVLITATRIKSYTQVGDEFGLDKGLNFSINDEETEIDAKDLDKDIRNNKIMLNEATSGGGLEETGERVFSLISPNEQLHTRQGQVGREAVRWRAAFWLRCTHYTLHNAPIFGIGFGNNLTNLLRNTPAWPLFIPSMSLGNRHPHSAHVTFLTRLGLFGFALWLLLLGATVYGALFTCWHYRKLAGEAQSDELRSDCMRRFWDGLTLLGIWVIFLWSMSFGVVIEGPMGGIWFWALTGALAWWEYLPEPVSIYTKEFRRAGG